MAYPSTADTELGHFYSQFAEHIAQARTLDDGVRCCIAALDSCFAPALAQLVWRAGDEPRVLAGAPEPIHQPTAQELASLEAGALALRGAAGRPAACFAPLRAQGELLGWLYVDEPLWGEESPPVLTLIAGQAGPALALLDALARREDRVAQLRTLNEIGRLLSGVLDLDSLLEAIHGATRRVVDAPVFFIAFCDQPGDALELAYIAQNGERQAQHMRWSPEVGLSGVVLRERQPLCTDDYYEECRRRAIPPRPFVGLDDVHAWLGVPLLAHDRLIGVMSVSSRRLGYRYRAEHIELLTTIAAQGAVAIENARLYQRSERQARQLATLNRIGRTLTSSLDPERVPALIIEQVTELLQAEEASLLLLDDASGDLVFAYTTGPVGASLLGHHLPRGAGLAGYVVEHGRSVIVNDVQQDERFDDRTDKTTGYVTRTLLAVPLRGVGGVQGVIEALNPRSGNHFTVEDQQMLEALADQAVIALENARRFAQIDQALARRAQELVGTNAQLQHNLRSLTALNALGMAINTTLRSADEIFSMTARGAVEITDALGACVLLDEAERMRAAVQIGPTFAQTPELLDLARQVIASGRPEVLQNVPAALARAGVRTILLVPLRATQRTLGGICVYYAGDPPDASNRETLVLFATQAAVAVESIDLFNAVRSGRDQMASILASTREGIMLVTSDAQVAIANAALHQLCRLPAQLPHNLGVGHFLDMWAQATSYVPEQWLAPRRELDHVMAGRVSFASGELNETSANSRSLEWAALTALRSGGSTGGALLVLRDITEAKESERLRHDLTNMIVHDLRSPLSSVMASIELMQKGIAGELAKTQQSVMSIAYASAVQMLEMINALLDVSRLEAGRMPVNMRPAAARPLFERAIAMLSSLARDQHVEIACEVAPDLPPVLADGELIVRVAQNLLGNALKFSNPDKRITVRAFATPRDGDAVATTTFAVADQGIGIAPQDQEKIFAKFSQVGERRGGTGLGLTFCKLVIEAHGGRIWVESTPGRGSTFFFTLPTAR
ncbi:GAF domain-containing protein [Kouleothrix sp.]|uniref:GAF domain-containing sensor histidine kinase n=1 Tax=Kouleothrix sp. TaxID=2779161 RepID=UPI00391D0C64